MKFVIALLFVFCYVECRKVYAPINKNANVDFINMESGGATLTRPAVQPATPVQAPTPAPKNQHNAAPTKAPPVTTAKSVVQPITVKPLQPVQPQPTPSQITPRPVYPTPASNPITTPGPGSVKQLVNFYDSRGNASPIRPYTYSQAVKQG